jgi:hypothetical protein
MGVYSSRRLMISFFSLTKIFINALQFLLY